MTSSIVAILIIALATGGPAYAQAQTPPDPGAAATPGSTNPSRSDPSTSTPAFVSPPSANHAQGKLSAGTVVQTPAGESIGTVKDVVPDTRTGQPRYIVIAPSSGANAAIPYSTLATLFIDGRIILDRSRLEKAPRVSDSQLRNPSDSGWQQKAQKYWSADGPK